MIQLQVKLWRNTSSETDGLSGIRRDRIAWGFPPVVGKPPLPLRRTINVDRVFSACDKSIQSHIVYQLQHHTPVFCMIKELSGWVMNIPRQKHQNITFHKSNALEAAGRGKNLRAKFMVMSAWGHLYREDPNMPGFSIFSDLWIPT